jgi:glycerate kinase
MPINIIDYSDPKSGERGVPLDHLCEDEWEMPAQIKAMDQWLQDNREKLKKGRYAIDIGFSPRNGAAGGGAVVSTEAMEIMSSIGMELILSEYPSFE